MTAPQPVAIPQPTMHTWYGSAYLLIFASEMLAKTVYSEKVEQPMKCHKVVPSGNEKRDVPSGMTD